MLLPLEPTDSAGPEPGGREFRTSDDRGVQRFEMEDTVERAEVKDSDHKLTHLSHWSQGCPNAFTTTRVRRLAYVLSTLRFYVSSM